MYKTIDAIANALAGEYLPDATKNDGAALQQFRKDADRHLRQLLQNFQALADMGVPHDHYEGLIVHMSAYKALVAPTTLSGSKEPVWLVAHDLIHGVFRGAASSDAKRAKTGDA